MTRRVSRFLIAAPAMAAVSAFAVAVSIRSVVMPAFVPGIGVVNGTKSLWSLLPWGCVLAALVVATGSLLPLIRPRGDAWVVPLVTATVVLTLAALMWAHWALNREDRPAALTMLILLSCVGVSLVIEAIMTRSRREAMP